MAMVANCFYKHTVKKTKIRVAAGWRQICLSGQLLDTFRDFNSYSSCFEKSTLGKYHDS